MKFLIGLLTVLSLTDCTSKTPYGDCVGINGQESPALKYEYSSKNAIVGIVFFEFVAPPVIVLLNELKCPVGNK
jgi:hypothetical protein